ncbi:RNA polymerase sigma factor [Brevibacillus marinus]|uniref:RNA polymerase sigma factor n=1 Tax=Brevibacillus marinus TaxID=2496837 RepID=UPI000F82CB47|nr:sigma-70 family RNA polymerase sigma factor [Brevibacillus marinus]
MPDDIEQRIGEIYRSHYRDVYHFMLYFTGNQNDAEDLTQDVFMRLLRSLSTYDCTKAGLKTWILSVAKNVAVDHYRKRKLSLLFTEKGLKKLPASDGIPEASLDAKEQERLIERLLQRLKPQYRMVIILRCIKGYSIRETAEILECSEAKVKVNYHRGIKQLQEKVRLPTEGGWLHELVT